ncbi:hypothetical protein FA15DRAFT_686976 [Coprinopsis marcescibilis]|uniref:BZIP domain-containing protein n=1 Tax=Coprinopsis marcescibilis TaxID=230819 RepID=A0A5C3KYN6_COPMA|nr:hypothetical protein FA15DRAFT_686976 [Coprinopsis marcescibilis]
MTRGRKKDLTIPPTRSLVQQRDYRARKASYIADLEQRCQKAEEENARLRNELDLARANMAVPFLAHPSARELSSELLQSLATATASLVKFQDFARQHPLDAAVPSSSRLQLEDVRLPPIQEPLHRTSQSLPSLPSISRSHPDSRAHGYHDQPNKRFCRHRSPTPPSDDPVETPASYNTYQQTRSSGSESSERDCCGGYFDCDGLCEGRSEYNDGKPTSSLHSNERTTANRRFSDFTLSPAHSSARGRDE